MTVAKTPRTQPSEVRRRDLLEAAAALFLQHGFDATPVDDIVARAGMSKGLFYHYFSSKQELLAALREQFIQQFHDRVQSALEQAPHNDWVARLACWIRASVQAYRDTLEMHDLVFSDHMRSNYQGERNIVTEPLYLILSEGQKAGVWSVADVDLTAWVIYQGMHGAVDNMGLDSPEQWAAMEDNLVTLFVAMLGAKLPH
ncbi:TetR family transcriptional regulator [Alcaligenes pakistanensis]|uniref:TetR family transcriptional regulator n=1 Tax=Alcaligenes pakistanensis TaxID=1482717 RepID=A0A8H9M734_9BURK|nr:TetR/AcrR family transcriptional regulator [Alcaligenes pakistanensis]MBP6621586.1 TetR/AcrR family transcriptional regulator [Alcaligenes sp.]GHC42903.1 TetR family transcriptional regulator [Alcaligenes pakistanensis]